MSRRIELTGGLGVFGWGRLDPLVLAALTTRSPVLLLGSHGTAKTLLAERVARALGCEFRHYNASLVNYDDLVGIPLPTETGSLRFVGTAGAVWGAEFVLFDEINRCRPDLQNKMFPVIHERRIAGQDLPNLVHRWAAMNPPGLGEESTGYLGTQPLDAALLDRFPLVVRVPDWKQLSREEREAIAAGAGEEPSFTESSLAEMVEQTKVELRNVEILLSKLITSYVVTLADLLGHAGVEVSSRRARMLTRSILAAIAAVSVLNRGLTPAETAELVLLNGLPQLGDVEPPALDKLIAAHNQAWEVASSQSDPLVRALLEEPDEVLRLHKGLRGGAGDDLLAQLTLRALSSLPARAEKVGLAAILTRAFAERPLTPAAWSSLADLSQHVLLPRVETTREAPGSRLDAWRSASSLLSRERAKNNLAALEDAYITGCGPDLLAEHGDPAALLSRFRRLVDLFEVRG